ncbi:MAG TPA: sulfite exporter TauE/SafE family protein [Gammaproteobacteria bacterium]|nr:sulfite exporter TauE/SafE family protein [Gammaproteobacteria bacterium]
MDFSILDFFLSLLVITLSAVVQAATGLGAGLLIVPLLALIHFDLVPGPVIFGSLALTALMSYRGRRDIRYAGMSALLPGLVAGMIVGALTVSYVPPASLGLVFGMLIILAVVLSARGLRVAFKPSVLVAAGVLSGFMGTTAAVGAPILALLYQHEEGKTLRATLAFLYLLSSVLMLLMLHLVGYFSSDHMVLGVYLMPGFVLGYVLAQRLTRQLDSGYTRPAVLMVSVVSALVLILKSAVF